MDLLIDFINEQRSMAYSSNLEKINYNVDQVPLLKQGIAQQLKQKKDAFSLITMAGRWILIYFANSYAGGDVIIHFVDFRLEINELEYGEVFSNRTIEGIISIQTQYDAIYTSKLDTVELNYAKPFSRSLIEEWEQDSCVNFAIALARLTGWLLHIDAWISVRDAEENIPEQDRVPLRVFVGDNLSNIFDVRGIQSIQEFAEHIITPLAREKAKAPTGSVSTRVYSEEQLFESVNIVKPDETKIKKAIDAIKANKLFLDSIPKRESPLYPAHIASKFSYGYCSPFAEALSDLKKLPTTSMIADEYTQQFELSRLGYIHSFVLHSDGEGEDSWGKQSIELIAKRFGVHKYHLDSITHRQVVENHKQNSPVEFQDSYNEAIEIINKYRV